MRMYAARYGRMLPDGSYAPFNDEDGIDLVAFYSQPPRRYIEQLAKGTERITFGNPGDTLDDDDTLGDMVTYTRWRVFGPELVPGTVREFDFCLVIERRDAVLGAEDGT